MDRYHHGIKAYTPLFLRLYDWLIIGIFTRFFWKCEGAHYVDLYRRHAAARHADIGVGTGYFLDHAGFDPATQRITLIDMNGNCLRHTARRLARYAPDSHLRNALQPIALGRTFSSICIGGLIHCVPGPMQEKGRIFDAIAPLCEADTVLFGYTLIGKDVRMGLCASLLMGFLNWLRVMDNRDDSVAGLRAELAQRFVQCEVWLVGCNAFFIAKNHRSASA